MCDSCLPASLTKQALFSSGDRKIGKVIERAAAMNGDIDRALRETGVDRSFHISRDRSYDEFLPWSIVDSGLSHEFLVTEHKKAREALSSLPCPAVEKCTTCGVCPSTWLADAPQSLSDPARQDSGALARLNPSTPSEDIRSARNVIKIVIVLIQTERQHVHLRW
jgi:hypothetical protein